MIPIAHKGKHKKMGFFMMRERERERERRKYLTVLCFGRLIGGKLKSREKGKLSMCAT